MTLTPELCPFREPGEVVDGVEFACCRLVGRITGADDPALLRVDRDTCQACCRAAPAGESVNPVVIALIFAVATRVMGRGGTADCEPGRARQLRDWAEGHLPLELATCPEPDAEAGDPAAAAALPRPAGAVSWAVGMITAPRSIPTIARSLRGLERAGFDAVHIFAEPGSDIPDEFRHLPVTRHDRRLGLLANYLTALSTLAALHPGADCFVVFEDDIEPAEGLKAWCERQLWPGGAGLVSLYTPAVHRADQVGWRNLSLGYHRTFGGLAFVFHRGVLERYLSDPLPWRLLELYPYANQDATLGAWAQRTGVGIAYHTPSLIRHIGEHSSIAGHANGRHGRNDAVGAVEQIDGWRPAPPEPGKVGLVGWNTATGLGYMNRDLAVHGAIDRWLVPAHPFFPTLEDPSATCRIDHVPREIGGAALRAWMDGLDWVLFVELPYVERFAQHARGLGISVAYVPMWELSHPHADWLRFVDLVLCPTDLTYRIFSEWRRRHRFTWEVVPISWPIDVGRFSFRLRTTCRRFVFINGTGGCEGVRPDGSRTPYRRKGLDLVFEAARRAPDLSILAYSQSGALPASPPNVELRDPPARNECLYDEGDVCVLPSHWEGLGLQMLECQAAGMPLVTTDAPPMTEHRPLRTVPVARTEFLSLFGNYPLAAQLMEPDDLVRVLRGLVGVDLGAASRAARAFVEQAHSWEVMGPLVRARLTR